ncbi:MAG TPA: hypothetical protein VHI71_00760 [Actinomycetota bacterium]|nr:hypothetical protein [Actinomycetota bacterium]
MRKSLTLATAGMIATAFMVAGPAAPAQACHNDIILSENPIHNWVCWTVHETGVEEKLADYVQQLYCIATQSCS